MAGKRRQRPRSPEAKAAQTRGATERREELYGFTYEWLRICYVSGMKQRQWSNRAQAARWLTTESQAVRGMRLAVLNPSHEASRGYSMRFYERIADWEKELCLPYRPIDEPVPCPDPDADFTAFDRDDF